MDILPIDQQSTQTPRRKIRSLEEHDSVSAMVSFVRSTTSKTCAKKPLESSKRLKKKLHEITDENALLAKQIDEKNREIDELKRSVKSLNDVLESVPLDQMRADTSIAARQILELSKKNRQYRAELDSKKLLINKRDLTIQKLEKELLELQEKQEQDTSDSQKGGKATAELQAKLNALQQKWFETRNKNTELQEKLKLAGKCLQQEIGDNFDLSKLNSFAAQNGSNWRGRAQQILHLQQTISEMRARIELLEKVVEPVQQMPNYASDAYDDEASVAVSANVSGADANEPNTAQLSAHQPRPRMSRSICSAMSFDRVSPAVRKSEIMHRAKVEELEKTIAELKQQLDEQRGKILALKVRNKTLNEDMLKYKSKANAIGAGDLNGMNLATLNDQLIHQKHEYESRIELLNRELKEVRQHYESTKLHEEELQAKLTNAETILTQRESELQQAKDCIVKLEQDMKSICGDFLFSCRELRKEEFVAILDSLETEKNFLLDQTKILNARVSEERNKNDNLNDTIGKHKLRITRLEARIKELEKELESTGEKKKRLQRISDYANNLNAKNGALNSLVFESTSRSTSSTCMDVETNPKISELNQKLEIANEKVAMLEDRLSYLNNEKELDAKHFEQALASSKSSIVETILTYRGERDSCTNVRSISFDAEFSKALNDEGIKSNI